MKRKLLRILPQIGLAILIVVIVGILSNEVVNLTTLFTPDPLIATLIKFFIVLFAAAAFLYWLADKIADL